MDYTGLVLIIGGLLSLFFAIKDYDWFMNHQKFRLPLKILGNRKRVRVYAIILSIIVVFSGVLTIAINLLNIFIDGDRAYDYFENGNKYCESKNYEHAVQEYSKAIEIMPNIDEAFYFNRGTAYYHQKKYDSALIDYKRAVDLDSNNIDAYNCIADILVLKKDYKNAIENINKSLKIVQINGSSLYQLYYSRGIAFMNLRIFDSAIIDFNKTIELKPSFSQVYSDRGACYAEGFKNYKKAIEDYNISIKMNSADPLPYENRGIDYLLLKEYRKAILDFDEVLKKDPESPKSYYFRGLAKYNTGKLIEACLDWRRSSELGFYPADSLINLHCK